MSNEESAYIRDTRGRPRSSDICEASEAVAKAYMTNKLPHVIQSDEPKKTAKRLRLSASFKEMQEEIGVSIRILVRGDEIVCCLRK